MGIEIGLIGIGGLGYLQAKTYADVEEVTLTAAADISADARDLADEQFDIPAYEDYREMLSEHANELDAVSIVTPHTLHYEQARACLEWDLNVLLEKPMVTEIEHAEDLVERAADRDLVLQVGYQRHFHPAYKEIRRIIGSGRIGDLHSMSCFLGQDWIDPQLGTWRTNPVLSGGGQLYDSGSHLMDVLLWTTDADPVSVSAQMEFHEPEIDVNSSLSIRLERDGNPILASVCISGDGTDMTPSEGYTYWGTEGQLTFTGGEISVEEKSGTTYETSISGGSDFQSLNRQKIRNFVASVRGTAEPAVPGEIGLEVTTLTEAAYRAAESESTVEVESLRASDTPTIG